MNDTMKKFGYPDTLVQEYARWVIQLRPQQVTLGSLVLICKDRATTFSQLSEEAFAELRQVTSDIEATLYRAFQYDKINYLMLMMVDPDVHFHVIPRYSRSRRWGGVEFRDYGWPGPPELTRASETDDAIGGEIMANLKQSWP